jgi:hypothetical protein
VSLYFQIVISKLAASRCCGDLIDIVDGRVGLYVRGLHHITDVIDAPPLGTSPDPL